jgi:hypothetical protein
MGVITPTYQESKNKKQKNKKVVSNYNTASVILKRQSLFSTR